MDPADPSPVVTPDIHDVLVRHDDGLWWIDNGFGVNVLKRFFDDRAEAVRLARSILPPSRGRVLVEDAEGWQVAETTRASVRLDTVQRASLADPDTYLGSHR